MHHFLLPRPFYLIPAVLLLSALAGSPALAATEPGKPTSTITQPADPLDKLFFQLKRERDDKQAKRISERIWAKWRDSGSATANLLVQWAEKAMSENKHALALDLLDQVITLMPDYAEGWNRRATLHFVMGNHGKSMADITRVLALEPRHFGAIAGMAAIVSTTGNDELELRAWEQILEIYPANRQAQKKVEELADKLAGDRI